MHDSEHDDGQATQPSVKRLGGAFVGLLQGHLELLGLELQEEKTRSLQLFLLAGIALILTLLVMIGVSAAIVIAFWDRSPIIVILVLCVLYAAGVTLCVHRAIGLARDCAHPFQATLEELARNREKLLP